MNDEDIDNSLNKYKKTLDNVSKAEESQKSFRDFDESFKNNFKDLTTIGDNKLLISQNDELNMNFKSLGSNHPISLDGEERDLMSNKDLVSEPDQPSPRIEKQNQNMNSNILTSKVSSKMTQNNHDSNRQYKRSDDLNLVSDNSPLRVSKTKRSFAKTARVSGSITNEKVVVLQSQEIDNNERLKEKVSGLTKGINKLVMILNSKDKLICNISDKLEKSLSNNLDLKLFQSKQKRNKKHEKQLQFVLKMQNQYKFINQLRTITLRIIKENFNDLKMYSKMKQKKPFYIIKSLKSILHFKLSKVLQIIKLNNQSSKPRDKALKCLSIFNKIISKRFNQFSNQINKFTIASKYIKEKHLALDNQTKMTRLFLGVEKIRNLQSLKSKQSISRRFNVLKNNAQSIMKNDYLVFKNKFMMVNTEKFNTHSEQEYLKKEYTTFKSQSDTKDLLINNNLQSIEQEYETMKSKLIEQETRITDLANENSILKKNQNTNIQEHNKNVLEENQLQKQTFQSIFSLVSKDVSADSSLALQTLKSSMMNVESESEKIRLKNTQLLSQFNKINNQQTSMKQDLGVESKKNKELQEGIDKLTEEVTHRDQLLAKISESLKNKQLNDSLYNEDLAKENTRLKTQLEQNDLIVDKIKKEISVLKHNDLLLKDRINELTEENTYIKANPSSLGKLEELQQLNNQYQENLELCMGDLKKLKQVNTRKDAMISDLNAKLENAQVRNEELSNRIEDLDHQLEELQAEVEQGNSKDNDVKQLERELKNLSVKLNSESREAANFKSKYEQLMSKFNNIKHENGQITAELIAGSSELSDLKSKFKQSKSDYENLQEENLNLMNTFKELSNELKSLKSERESIKKNLSSDMNSNKHKVLHLEKKVEELTKTNELYREYKDKQEELSQQHNHLAKLGTEAHVLQRQVAESTQHQKAIESENEVLRNDNDRLQEKVSVLSNELGGLKREFTDIASDRQKQGNTVSKLLEEMDKQAKIIGSMENKLKDEQYKYRLKEQELEDTKKRYREIQN